MKLLFTDDWLRRKLAENPDEPGGCIACGAIAGACDEYPNCPGGRMEIHPPDTETEVRFYGCEFYCLSNFSAFQVVHRGGLRFMTAEHVYHWEKFNRHGEEALSPRAQRTLGMIRAAIMDAPSAHEALKIARRHEEEYARLDWRSVRVDLMREILGEKIQQHEYVMRKLVQTGTRAIIEDSWRDAFWGIGPEGNGENMLGKLWMEIRAGLKPRTA